MAETHSSYNLTRFMILRLLGLVYTTAFFILVQQWKPLLGQNGLTPVPLYMGQVLAATGSTLQAFLALPSLFWLNHSDTFMLSMGWVGLGLSILVLVGFANGLLLTGLWFLYMSFVHLGQTWYSFGWEIQILETGFLAIFLVPFWNPRPFPKSPPPVAVIWLFRWLIFRIMLGSALIKLRGDDCWRDLTCLKYHYETQPIPNFLSPYFHFMPLWFHKLGVLFNYWAELVSPWLMAIPGWGILTAGLSMAVLQIILILSGNLAFLNWLTLVPVLACFNDAFWAKILPRKLVEAANKSTEAPEPSQVHKNIAWILVAAVAVLSLGPVENLLSSRQAMNTSFNAWDLVNTYGAFGSVGRERLQLVVEGTGDAFPTKKSVWKEYAFKAQPGPLTRRPPWLSPYYYRLDWLVWFAAMGDPNQYPWMLNLVWKLLQNDPGALSMLGDNPFPEAPPKAVRVHLYRYHFAPLSHPGGLWWVRDDMGMWLPPVSKETPELGRFIGANGWD